MLWVANLGFEAELAAAADRKRPRRALGGRSLAVATRAGTLLRILASEGDTVWLPGPPDRFRPEPVPGLPTVEYIHGDLPRVWTGPALAWGETPATATLGAGVTRDRDSGSPVLDALRSVPRPDPEAAARTNRKTWLIPLREALGCPVPGSGIVRSPGDLDRLVEDCRRIHGDGTGWTLKGDYSAAGRERLVGGPEALERLLRCQGACLLEPWLERTADFGCSLLVEYNRVRLAGVHRLLVSPGGRFQGVETSLHSATEPGPVTPDRFEPYLAPVDAVRMARVAVGAAAALVRAGYRGHAGIDFWTYRAAGGQERLNPLGEINARLTFGLVAGVLAQRVGAVLNENPGTRFRLTFVPESGQATGRCFPLVSSCENNASLISFSLSG